jgi:SAM-dependent methyltransferase
MVRKILKKLHGTLFHPQWLSDVYHNKNRVLIGNIKKGRVVDIGSGDSNIEKYINNEVELIKVDYPCTNIRYINNPNIYANAESLPFAQNSFDAVLLLEVIEHICRFDIVLDEIKRILKKNGLLYISAPFIYPAHDVPYDFHRFTRDGLKQDLERHGFKIEIIEQHGNSLVVSLQMLNLVLLETVVKISKNFVLLGIFLAVIFYPLCLLNNVIASPFLRSTIMDAAVFGHFIVAKLTDSVE